ncbi:hypothetical protein [Streptomyces graminilatus]|uniref:hypothetical protein n=1 Tax=Streptomyces graminilatus TaxID=1464070 RepID=UPI0006E257C0|nr:hypothetical protein [Streptomyces graminilatus]
MSCDRDAPVPVSADAALISRVTRLRTALLCAGADLERVSGPAPAWFASLAEDGLAPRSLTPQEQRELGAHLAGLPIDMVLTDIACDRAVQRIETLSALSELRSEGIDLYPCSRGGNLLDVPAASLHQLADYVRQQVAEAKATEVPQPDRSERG